MTAQCKPNLPTPDGRQPRSEVILLSTLPMRCDVPANGVMGNFSAGRTCSFRKPDLRLLWTVVYLGRRFLRADSQHNAATVEQARVESGYDEEVILLNRTR
jgi:hypothetical protein